MFAAYPIHIYKAKRPGSGMGLVVLHWGTNEYLKPIRKLGAVLSVQSFLPNLKMLPDWLSIPISLR